MDIFNIFNILNIFNVFNIFNIFEALRTPHTHNWPIRPEPKEYLTVGGNEFTNDSYSYMASAGDLVIFPSSIPHWVPVNTTDENRVSISFNTFPKIPFGGLDNTTRLT